MQNIEKYIKKPNAFKAELKRILDKNFDFQTIIGAFDEEARRDKVDLYRALTQEEVKEFNDALSDDDISEAVKELSDIFVVASVYGALQFGCNIVDHVREEPPFGEVNKIYVQEAAWKGQSEVTTVENIFTLANKMAQSFTFDFLPYLEAVIDNNFDKLPLIETVKDPDKDAKTIEEKSKGRYTGVSHEVIMDAEGNERYKFTDSNGKVMKPVGYETIKLDIE